MERDRAYLIDIVQSANLAMKYLRDLNPEAFLADQEKQDAVVRRLEIIGEAARRLSDETKGKLAEIPWRKITGMRNFVIHQYDSVDLTVVFDTVKGDLPPLVAQIEAYLAAK